MVMCFSLMVRWLDADGVGVGSFLVIAVLLFLLALFGFGVGVHGPGHLEDSAPPGRCLQWSGRWAFGWVGRVAMWHVLGCAALTCLQRKKQCQYCAPNSLAVVTCDTRHMLVHMQICKCCF